MLTCVRATWIKFAVSCICMLIVNEVTIIFAAPLRENEPETLMYWNTRSEAGFDLDQEDMAKFHIWPTGIIPYYIDDFSFDKVLRDRIRMFINGVNKLTALRFVEISKPPEDNKSRWVLFINRKGLLSCADHPFKHFTNEGLQKIVLGYDCMNSDENLADIVLSLVGVPPQHNAPNRDEKLDIREENILPDKLYLFEKLKDSEWLFHNLTYDFDSAGHYGPYKHTSNGYITVERKLRDNFHIFVPGIPTDKPKEKGFSSQDVLKIAMLYNYILRNRETPVPECSKLFAPGSKPVSLEQDTNPNIKPRKKPSKYLGESEKEQVSDDEGNYNGEMNDKKLTDDNERDDSKKISDENITNVKSDSENNANQALEHDENVNDDNYKKLNFTDGNKKENGLDDNESEGKENYYTDNERNSNEMSDQGNNKNENNEVTENITTYDGTTNNTRYNDRKPLAHKLDNSKKQKLLGQSDYETGDEGKNRYIHEKNL